MGADDCIGMNVRCELPQPAKNPYSRVVDHAMSDVQQEITPTWVRALPLPPGSQPLDTVFTSDLEGGLWLFSPKDDHIVAARLDADGGVIESSDISPPSQLQSAQSVAITAHRQSAVGPTLDVQWQMENLNAEQGPISDVGIREWLRFGATLDVPIIRIAALGAFNARQVTWAADGSVYVLSADGQYLGKYDSDLKLLWQQAAFRALSDLEMPLVFGLLDGTAPVLFSKRYGERDDTTIVHVVDEHGNFSPSGEISPALPIGEDSDPTAAALITNGPAVVSGDGAGNLLMLHVQPKPFGYWGVELDRSGYELLQASPTAVDRGGSIYAAPYIDGPDLADLRHAICRMPPAYDSTACFVVTRTADTEITFGNSSPIQLGVDGDGVVYLRYGDRLMRVDLPAVQ